MNKKILGSLLLPLSLVAVSGCNSESDDETEMTNASIGVAADLHYYDSDLGTEGEAFEEYLAHDRKLIAESEALTTAFTEVAITSGWDYLLVPGDLTKDGEYASHSELAEYFAAIELAGVEVLLSPEIMILITVSLTAIVVVKRRW